MCCSSEVPAKSRCDYYMPSAGSLTYTKCAGAGYAMAETVRVSKVLVKIKVLDRSKKVLLTTVDKSKSLPHT